MPRPFPPEFRRRVIDLIESGQSVAEVAEGIEVSDQTIYNWWNQHLINTGRKVGVSSTDNAELTAARKRIAEQETELAAARRANELLRAVVPPKGVRAPAPSPKPFPSPTAQLATGGRLASFRSR